MAIDHGLWQLVSNTATRWTTQLVGWTFALGMAANLQFGRRFLNTRVHTPRIDLFLRGCIALAFVYFVVTAISLKVALYLSLPLLIPAPFTLAVAGFIVWRRKKQDPAKYYFFAWALFIFFANLSNIHGVGLATENL